MADVKAIEAAAIERAKESNAALRSLNDDLDDYEFVLARLRRRSKMQDDIDPKRGSIAFSRDVLDQLSKRQEQRETKRVLDGVEKLGGS